MPDPTDQQRSVPEPGAQVECWPGVRPGRSYVGTVMSGVVDFCGTPTVRIQKPPSEGGGGDYIAVTHVAALRGTP